jgi:NADH-quinone oxidoreductase subunit M
MLTFTSIDLVLFYFSFEAVLIPMFFLIGIWGGKNRIYASFKLFIYTFFGSVFLLLAIIKLYIETGESNFLHILTYNLPEQLELWLFGAFFIAFAIKIPMFPVHTWLPDAHTEAPTAGSVLLAGVLLKMGGYGMLRFCLPLFPNACQYFAPLINTLSLIAIVYTSLVALAQSDMKKLIAYSSIAHMGFVTLGIFSFTPHSMSGAVFQMISHGLISAALFMCIGILYERFHTREISFYSGLNQYMPYFCGLFMVFSLASVGLPGTSGFVGEMLVIIGTFKINSLYSIVAASGMFLSAAYALWLYKRMCQGPNLMDIDVTKFKLSMDINAKESFNLVVLSGLVIFFGFSAQPILALVNPAIMKIKDQQSSDLFHKLQHKKTKIDKNADLTLEQRKKI